MSRAREGILAAIRRAYGRGPLDSDTCARLDAAMTTPTEHPRPTLHEDPIRRFIDKLEGRSASVARVSTRADIPGAVECFRADRGLPHRAAVGAALGDLIWPPEWSIHADRAVIDDALAVSLAFAGIAETGTLMLLASPGSPTTHNFVPESQVVVLETGQLVRHVEDAWAALRRRGHGMPRVVNLISGPSRTADIEQTIQLGAHGPRRLHLILVGLAPSVGVS